MADKGISHSVASLDVLGTVQVETRMYLGEEFPIRLNETNFKGWLVIHTLVNSGEISCGERDMTARQGQVGAVLP